MTSESRVAELVSRARAAMTAFADADQARADEAVTALAWAIYEPGRARALAQAAVDQTRLGDVESKVIKNQRKTFGCLRDLMRIPSVGVIEDDPARGIVKYAKPVGVVCAVTPSTNPVATPVNKAMFAVKSRNAVIVAPSPAASGVTAEAVEAMRAELARIRAPKDLVQVLPRPVDKASTRALMEACDLVVVTGSQDNVRSAYRSGTPAIGVGAGNVPVVIDGSADLEDAARKICLSKTFDNATSCSSENSVLIMDAVYDDAVAALRRAGGFLCPAEARERIRERLWVNGRLNRTLIARDSETLRQAFALGEEARGSRFFMVEEPEGDPESPFTDEKLSLVLTVYRCSDMEDAVARLRAILEVNGKGHSVGIHTADPSHAERLAREIDVVRVLVNQAHTFGNGGSFDNALPFTLSMGGGTWAGNSITENLNARHFMNITHLVRTIPEDRPTEEALFGAYWARHGR
jgi:sulfoacetaldehyde dehydrogenase